jgi:hypothetical protein
VAGPELEQVAKTMRSQGMIFVLESNEHIGKIVVTS